MDLSLLHLEVGRKLVEEAKRITVMETVVAGLVQLPDRLKELNFFQVLFIFFTKLETARLGEYRFEVQLVNESDFLFEVRRLFLFLLVSVEVELIVVVIDFKYLGLRSFVQGHVQHQVLKRCVDFHIVSVSFHFGSGGVVAFRECY